MKNKRLLDINKRKNGYGISFNAMASLCEVLIETNDKVLAEQVGRAVAEEVWRIEDKFSRYSDNSICAKINNSAGKAVEIDNETFLLLNFADQCFQLSDGLFDITSGVLRKVWRFDCSDNIPTKAQVSKVMSQVGWENVVFNDHQIILPEFMELDFGGIGKEYAVDRAVILVRTLTKLPTLVNLGGDLCATSPQCNGQPWQVGVEQPIVSEVSSNKDHSSKGHSDKVHSNKEHANKKMIVSLYSGELATSGDAKRFLLKYGIRYSHILNAQTGWPIENAPSSMTVVAPQCIQAGLLATLALMQGAQAEAFLQEQDVKFWAIR